MYSHQHIVQQHIPPVCHIVAPARAHAALSLCMRYTTVSAKVSILDPEVNNSCSLLHSEILSQLSCRRCPRSRIPNQCNPLTEKRSQYGRRSAHQCRQSAWPSATPCPKDPKCESCLGRVILNMGSTCITSYIPESNPMPWTFMPPHCLMLYVSQSNSCRGCSYLLIACVQSYACYPSAQRCTAGQHALEICNRPG